MKISKLDIKNYRNLSGNSFDFDDKVNYIYGQNAQGKTNLLEAIWMFTGARSFRKTKDADLIKFGESSAKLDYRDDWQIQDGSFYATSSFAHKRWP